MYNYITLPYITPHHATPHHTRPYHTIPHYYDNCSYNCNYHCKIQIYYATLRYTTYATVQYNYSYSCATPHYIQQLWVRWPLQPLQPFQKIQLQPQPRGFALPSMRVATIHLSYSVLYNETFATALCGTTGKTCFQLSCHALPAFRWCFCNVTAFNMSDLQHPCQYHTHGLHESRLRLWEWKALPSERWNLRKMMEEYLAAVEASNPWANNCNYLPQAWHENAWKECCRNVRNMCVESRKASLRLPRPNSSTNPLVQLWPWTTDVFLIQWTRSLAMQDDARPRGGNPKAQKARGFAPVTNSNFVTYKSYKI